MHLSAIPISKILKKGVQIGSKFKRRFDTQEGHSAHEKCRSPKSSARPKDYWIEINLTLFDFLEIRMHPNSYLIIQLIFRSISTSINRGCLLKFSILFDLPLSSSFLLIFQIPLC